MMYKFGVIFAFLVAALPVGAKDLYVAANQVSTGSGTGCSTAKSVAWFNNTASWGTGSTQIGPGTTVHLCGTFTGSAGQQLLLVHGNGTSSARITIKFQPGAILTAPYWSALGAIRMDNHSYITVDGGGSGIIRNTANGTGLAYHMASRAIYAPNCAGCTVQNIIIANLYVHTAISDVSAPQSQINCAYALDANSFTVDHVTCHDTGWAVVGGANNLTIEYSDFYNVDHGLAFGPRGVSSGFSIHDNHIHGYANWDNTTNVYHHDGLHMWGQSGGVVSNGAIYNNLFDGDCGANITAHIFLQDSVKNVAVYNNVFLVPANRIIQALWFQGVANSGSLPGGVPTGNSAYNNFIRAGGHNRGSGMLVAAQYNFTAYNNVLQGGNSDIAVESGGSLSSSGINNNVYEDLLADVGSYNSFAYQGHTYRSLAQWQAACRCDSRSKLEPASRINANSLGQLLSGSVAISAAANLLNISSGTLALLSKDKVGAQRQLSSTWDAGAYKYGSVAPLSSPTGLTATVQ